MQRLEFANGSVVWYKSEDGILLSKNTEDIEKYEKEIDQKLTIKATIEINKILWSIYEINNLNEFKALVSKYVASIRETNFDPIIVTEMYNDKQKYYAVKEARNDFDICNMTQLFEYNKRVFDHAHDVYQQCVKTEKVILDLT